MGKTLGFLLFAASWTLVIVTLIFVYQTRKDVRALKAKLAPEI